MCPISASLFHLIVKPPIGPSAVKQNKPVKLQKVGDRRVMLHSRGKYPMHHAGFIAAMLQDFDAKVLASKTLMHVTDKCGSSFAPRQMSRKAFVNEWIKKTTGGAI